MVLIYSNHLKGGEVLMSLTHKPRISVSNLSSLIDEPINIKILGVPPRKEVTIKAKRVSNGEKTFHFSSYATFLSDEQGTIDLNEQIPLNGSYSVKDGMGLFWSLEIIKREDNTNKKSINPPVLPPQSFTLSLEIDNEIVDEITIKRLWKAENISRESIRENGIVGTFFHNEDGKPYPAIIILGGSEGGLNEFLGSLLASRGFTVLVLAYFGLEHLPKRLVEIPLEYIEKAIDWLKERPETQKGWLGIHGVSRGSELALLSASLFQDIKAVVSLNGSAILFSGIVPWSDEETLPPAWVYKGEPFPYASAQNPTKIALECLEMYKERKGNPLVKWYKALTSDSEVVRQATIKVEKINGPILLISGKEDITVEFSRKAIERLKEFHFNHQFEHLIYPGANHSLGIPYVYYGNGKKKETAFASADSWKKTIKFFAESSSKR